MSSIHFGVFFFEKRKGLFLFSTLRKVYGVILKNNAQVFLGIHKNWTWFEVGNLLDSGL